MTEFPRTAEELGLVGRETDSADDLGLKKAKRTYEVCSLKKPVFARFYGLRKFNGTRSTCRFCACLPDVFTTPYLPFLQGLGIMRAFQRKLER